MEEQRQEKTLREFKQVLDDLVNLLRHSTGVETVYLYWVNTIREQFVLESYTTRNENVMFEDRVSFNNLYLKDYKDISEPVQLEVGQHITTEALSHYFNKTPVRYITLLPCINNGETIAITALESSEQLPGPDQEEILYSYLNAFSNVLHTYLEINDLTENQEEWVEYEEQLAKLDIRASRVEFLEMLIDEMQKYLHDGGVSLLARGMGSWNVVLNAGKAHRPPPIGLVLEPGTLGYNVLQKGEPDFGIHFNSNPKRISPREPQSNGATLAVPIMIDDRRQALIVAYDENPLVFKESTKHKLINLARTASLKISVHDSQLDISDDLLTNRYNAYIPELWEHMVRNELERIKAELSTQHTWVGLASLADLSSLRTKLRLEELRTVQSTMVKNLNPGRHGIPGVVGYNTDYVYALIVQGKDDSVPENLSESLKKEFATPVNIPGNRSLDLSIRIGFTKMREQENFDEIYSQAKQALSESVKSLDKHITITD